MEELEVWHLASLPLGAKVIKHKWVFIKKMKSNGNIDKFKARLVACGYAQVHGLNYFETFAPTVSLENVRMVLAMAAHVDWEAHQVDVKTTFLNATLDEDVYMTVPEGVDTKNGTAGNCVKLNKTMYGLKQALRA